MGDIILTTSENERDAAAAAGYRSEGAIGHLYPAPDEREVLVANHGFVDEGVECHVFRRAVSASQASALGATPVPLHLLRSTGSGEHFYTTDAAERDRAVTSYGYRSLGVACWVFAQPVTGTVPLYRCYSGGTGDHFYAVDAADRDQAVAAGYTDEGIAAHVYPSALTLTPDSPVPLTRMYDPTNGDHYYMLSRLTAPLFRLANPAGSHLHTASPTERADAVQSGGYADDGVAGYLFPEARPGAVALNRLTGPDGQTFLSPFGPEQTYLTAAQKYVSKGTAGWIFDAPRSGTAPLYRLTNGPDTGRMSTMTADLTLVLESTDSRIPSERYTLTGLRITTFVAPDRTDLTPPTTTLTFAREGNLGMIAPGASHARRLVLTITRMDPATRDRASGALSARLMGRFKDPDLSIPTTTGTDDLSVFNLTTGTADQRTGEYELKGLPLDPRGRFTLVGRAWLTASIELRSRRCSLTWSGTFDPVP